jgi:hypothetical protein
MLGGRRVRCTSNARAAVMLGVQSMPAAIQASSGVQEAQ